MDIKEILQKLNEFLKMPMNEMAIKTTPNRTKELGNKSIPAIMDILKEDKYGFVETKFFVNILKECEINSEKYQLCINWGEPSKFKSNKTLQGHGIYHQLEGHKKDYEQVKRNFEEAINRKDAIYNTKRGTYDITYLNTRYGFDIIDEKNKQVIFITGFKIK